MPSILANEESHSFIYTVGQCQKVSECSRQFGLATNIDSFFILNSSMAETSSLLETCGRFLNWQLHGTARHYAQMFKDLLRFSYKMNHWGIKALATDSQYEHLPI